MDLTGAKELELIIMEYRHRCEMQTKRLELEKDRIALARENQNTQTHKMQALINKRS